MRRLPKQKKFAGFIQLAPVLAIAILLFVGILATSQKNSETRVLSESSGTSDRSGESSTPEPEDNNDDDNEEVDVRVDSSGTSATGGVRIRTRIEDDRFRTEIFRNGRRIRVETRDGQSRVRVENKDEEVEDEFEIEDEEEIEVEASEEARLRIRTSEGRFIIREGRIEAETSFPLSIDLTTNELIVTTPSGAKRVAVLPQQAIDNIIRVGHVDVIAPEAAETRIEIVERDGRVIYVIEGLKRKRFLGFLEVFIPRVLEVSGDTGELITTRQNLIDRILELLSS